MDFRTTDCSNETKFTKAVKIHEQAHTGDLETSCMKRASCSTDPRAAVFKEQKQEKLYNFYLVVNTFIAKTICYFSSKSVNLETQEVVTRGRGALGAPAGVSGWVVSPPTVHFSFILCN